MNPGTQIILSGTLTFGVPLALAVRDLLALRRSSGGGWRPEPPEPVFPKPPSGGCPARPALPTCLIEAARFQPNRPALRELERV